MKGLWNCAFEKKFVKFLYSSDQFKSTQSTLSPNEIGLSRRGGTAKQKTAVGRFVNIDEGQIPLTVEQPSHGCHTAEKRRPKITEKDVLKAHGIIQDRLENVLIFKPNESSP